MQYLMLLWPHANARYRAEAQRLALCEARILLGEGFAIEPAEHLGLPALRLEGDGPLPRRLRDHSLLYGLYEARPDGSLAPVMGRREALLGEDLPGILKYKGKTNELFTQMLLNVARGAAQLPDDAPLRLLDPMCGRGTSLFLAVNLGWTPTGSDVDKAALKEGEQFFKRYLEYHRVKHRLTRQSLTVGGRPAPCAQFTFPRGEGENELRLVQLDAADVRRAFGAGKFEIVACDLPYGVQHASKGGSLLSLLARALPAWRDALTPGGAVAVSFNAQTTKLEDVRRAMADAGLAPLTGGPWDGFAHWVEQAVTRDVAVAAKPF